MTNSVVISKIDAVMHVVLSKAKKKKKTHAVWRINWYRSICEILISRCHTTNVVITEFNCKQTNKQTNKL